MKSFLLVVALVSPGLLAAGEAREWMPLLHNAAAVERVAEAGDTSVRMTRLPLELLPRVNRNARTRAYSPAGVELRFRMTGEVATLTLRMVEDRAARTRGAPVLAEVRYGDHLARVHVVAEEWTTIAIPAPPAQLPARREPGFGFDPQLVRVLLPYAVEIRLKSLEGGILPAPAGHVPRPRALAYGSSITHGYDGVLPGNSYPAQLGRIRGWEIFNLGFGAGAHLEQPVAEWIAARSDWDVAILELGVNLLGSVDETEFDRRVRAFLQTIVEAHPTKPVFVIDIFRSGRDVAGHPKQASFRRIVQENVARIGRQNVVHLDGLELLRDMRGLSSDLLHPNPDGFHEIARRLDAAISASQLIHD